LHWGLRGGCQAQHRAQAFGKQAVAGNEFVERLGQPGELQSRAQPRRIGQDFREYAPHQPVGERALIGLFDMHPRVIDQVHVIDTGGAGCHTGQAG
jgi:hypothetical protein